MLSALVVMKSDKVSSDGFFFLAEELAEEYRGKKGTKHLVRYDEDNREAWFEDHKETIYGRAECLDAN